MAKAPKENNNVPQKGEKLNDSELLIKTRKKRLRLILMTVATLAVAGGLYYNFYLATPSEKKVMDIHGVWYEQDAGPRAGDFFEIRDNAVFKAGRVLSSSYIFNGTTLSFSRGGLQYKFNLDKNTNSFTRVEPADYKAIYRKQLTPKEVLQSLPPLPKNSRGGNNESTESTGTTGSTGSTGTTSETN